MNFLGFLRRNNASRKSVNGIAVPTEAFTYLDSYYEHGRNCPHPSDFKTDQPKADLFARPGTDGKSTQPSLRAAAVRVSGHQCCSPCQDRSACAEWLPQSCHGGLIEVQRAWSVSVLSNSAYSNTSRFHTQLAENRLPDEDTLTSSTSRGRLSQTSFCRGRIRDSRTGAEDRRTAYRADYSAPCWTASHYAATTKVLAVSDRVSTDYPKTQR